MSQVDLFKAAFHESGIGGKFSKFKLSQQGNWFTLVRDGIRPEFSFKVCEVFNRRMIEEISMQEAFDFKCDNLEWVTNFSVAKEVLRVACSKRPAEVANTAQENCYYIDRVKEVVYLTNRSNVIACSPVYPICPMLSTNVAVWYLTALEGLDVTSDDALAIYTFCDNVVIYHRDKLYHTDMTPRILDALYKD